LAHWGYNGPRQSPFHLGAVLVLLGCVWTCLGTAVLRSVWPAVLVMAFLVPVPGMARQRISLPLEQVTAAITAHVLHWFELPVTRQMNQISINHVPVTVAEACNGLRMLFPLFLIVYVFVFTVPLRPWVRWVLILTSPISAIACNVARLMPTVLLYGYAPRAWAQRFHDYSGWAMVPIAFVALMGVVRVLRMMGLSILQENCGAGFGLPSAKQAKACTTMVAPALTLGLLGGIVGFDKLRVDPADAAPFLQKTAAAIAALPKNHGNWYTVQEIPLGEDECRLLDVNASVHRAYVNVQTHQTAEVLLVQCRDARAMQGHFPPVCYPSNGCKLRQLGGVQEWLIGAAHKVPGIEYEIVKPDGQAFIVRDFFVLPNGRYATDMTSVIAAAKNYQELVYGGAQLQVLFRATVPPAERDAIFSDLLAPYGDLLDVLRSAQLTKNVESSEAGS
jgi:exosortase